MEQPLTNAASAKQTMSSTLPISNRIYTIDIIRGVALLGILLFNVQTFSLFGFLEPQQVYDMNMDRQEVYAPLQFFLNIFVRGQFYTIYSFLFGLGFYMIMKNAETKGLDGKRIFKRRLWALLIFGLVHGLVFWFGDILHKYAILGFTLLYFNRKSVPTLLKWVFGMMGFIVVSQIIIAVMAPPTAQEPNPEMNKVVMEVVNTWKHGSVMEVLSMQKLGFAMLWMMSAMNGFANMIIVEVMFLLGLIAGKLNLFSRIAEIRLNWKKTVLIAFPLLILLKAFSVIDLLAGSSLLANDSIGGLGSWLGKDGLGSANQYMFMLRSIADYIAMPLMAICYLVLMALFFDSYKSRVFNWIGNTGRLGLTNYFMQTLICSLIFYGYGLGLAGKITLADSLLTALLIYIFQIIYSNLWLKFMSIGPLELMWKSFSYRRKG